MRSHKFLSVLTLLLSAGILFTSCKKDDAPAQTCRIITVTPNIGNANNITYNSDGKPETITNGNSKTVYSYSGNTVIGVSTNNGNFNSKSIITLNANGFASNVKTETSANSSTWYNQSYEYSGTEVIKQTYTNSQNVAPQITTVTWGNGNLLTTTQNGVVTTVEYYNDKLSQSGDYLDINQLISGFYIYRTKNLIKSFISGSDISSFEYTFEDGKIIGMKAGGGGSFTTYSYQRQCN